MRGKRWSDDTLAVLRQRYPHERTQAIADDLGMSLSACYQAAQNMGIKKTQDYLNGTRLGPAKDVGMGTRFQPGQAPANKGLRRPGWAPGDMAKTQFQKGKTPHNTKPIGSYRIDAQGMLQQKISNDKGSNSKRWRGVHEQVWIAANGPMPPGHLCVFRPGMRTVVLEEITADKVECISLAENMRRNTVHNLPKELVDIVRLRAVVVRHINKRTKGEKRNEHRDHS